MSIPLADRARAAELKRRLAEFWGISLRCFTKNLARGVTLVSAAEHLLSVKNQRGSRSVTATARLADPATPKALALIFSEVETMIPPQRQKKESGKKVSNDTEPPATYVGLPPIFLSENADDDVEGDAPDLNTARLRKTNLEAQKLRLAIAKERGEFISKAEAKESCQAITAVFSAEIQSMLGDLPGQLAGLDEASVLERLKGRFDLAFVNLKNGLEAL